MKLLSGKAAPGIKATAVVLTTLFIYNQDLTIVANEALRSELMSHILAVPFLIAYLTCRKRKMLMARAPPESSTTADRSIAWWFLTLFLDVPRFFPLTQRFLLYVRIRKIRYMDQNILRLYSMLFTGILKTLKTTSKQEWKKISE